MYYKNTRQVRLKIATPKVRHKLVVYIVFHHVNREDNIYIIREAKAIKFVRSGKEFLTTLEISEKICLRLHFQFLCLFTMFSDIVSIEGYKDLYLCGMIIFRKIITNF